MHASQRPVTGQQLGESLVADWQTAGLIKHSVLKPVLTTIEQALVARIMGKFATADIRMLEAVIAQIIG